MVINSTWMQGDRQTKEMKYFKMEINDNEKKGKTHIYD